MKKILTFLIITFAILFVIINCLLNWGDVLSSFPWGYPIVFVFGGLLMFLKCERSHAKKEREYRKKLNQTMLSLREANAKIEQLQKKEQD